MAIGLSACAQTLDPPASPDSGHFQFGITRKEEVANVLGLPSSRADDTEFEYWNYPAGPVLTRVDAANVSVSGGAVVSTVRTVHVDAKQVTAIVYIFRRDGVLAAIRDLRSGQ